MGEAALLRMEGISKTFPGVHALDNVHLEVEAGTVHALMGENGAGKSTLMKVLAGIYKPDAGSIWFNGETVAIPDSATALRLGISMIHQELSPVPEMSVAENIFLGREPRNRFGFVDRRQMVAKTTELFAKWQIEIEPRAGKPGARAFDVFLRCFEKGVLIRVTGDIIALSPPLICSQAQIDQLTGTIADALKAID